MGGGNVGEKEERCQVKDLHGERAHVGCGGKRNTIYVWGEGGGKGISREGV